MANASLRITRAVSGALLALCCLAPVSHAQRNGIPPVPVFSSPKGMYVFCGMTIASTAHPVGDTVGYRVERRAAGGAWTRVADVSAAASLDQFRAQTGDSLFHLIRRYMKAPSDEAVWDSIVARPQLNRVPYNAELPVLTALGSIVLDRDVTRGTSYEYRLSTLLRSGGTASARVSERAEFGAPWRIASMRVLSKDETDSSVTIVWGAPQITPLPSRFHVYRRMTGREEFRRIPIGGGLGMQHDTLTCTVYDRHLVRNQQYDYYVVPEDFVENTGPVSEQAAIFTINPTRLPLPQELHAVRDSAGIRLTWRTTGRDLILSTRIFRSMFFDSGYVRIAELPATDSMYEDQTARGMVRYYYRFQNVSYDNRVSQMSAVVFGYFISSIPPSTPHGLTAKSVDRGVELTWAASGEEDFAGWYVSRAERIDDSVGTVISPLLQTNRFVDTSATLRGTIEYRYTVVALSTSQKRSEPSPEVRARPRIPTNPKPPRNVTARQMGDAIGIAWDDARAYDPLVSGYTVYRFAKGDDPSTMKAIAGWSDNPEKLTLIDSAVIAGKSYIYAVASRDAFGYEGIRSAGAEGIVRITVSQPPSAIHASRGDRSVLVEWDPVFDDNASSFVLYRNERGKPPVKLAALDFRQRSYTDRDVVAGTVYYYSVSVVDRKGREGPKSDAAYAVP